MSIHHRRTVAIPAAVISMSALLVRDWASSLIRRVTHHGHHATPRR